MTKGNIFNIQRFSIHDGPGIRTTVFFKGCTLRCVWCHNPESFEKCVQVMFFDEKCVKCAKCVAACPNNAQVCDGRSREWIRDRCGNNLDCALVCDYGALVISGKYMDIEEVMKELRADIPYYEMSNGGVTFSGGEPLIQIEFLKQLETTCKKEGIHTAVDTAGCVDKRKFEQIIDTTDLFLYDIKCMDEKTHLNSTGSDNRVILDNLLFLSQSGAKIRIRIPVIPDFNDNKKEMGAICDHLTGLSGIEQIDLIPFHKLGSEKYKSLGLEYVFSQKEYIKYETLLEFADIFKKKGFAAVVMK